jgi:predicted transcriptional regulator
MISYAMPRILADLPADEIKRLDQIAAAQGKSRASVLREAVSAYRAEPVGQPDLAWIRKGAGAWKDRTDIGDSVEWQRRERAGWTRPWDDNYEETRAEFPDLFDAEDDRQRQIYLDMVAGKMPIVKMPDGQ